MEILKPRVIEVHQDFVNHANNMCKKKGWERWRGDSLLYEWWLKNRGLVKKEKNWRHDFIVDDMKIDVKEIHNQYFNIHSIPNHDKIAQYRESIISGELTHFLFYKTDKEQFTILKHGDIVKISPFALCDARSVIKSVTKSIHDNTIGFVSIDTLLIIGDINESKEKP